MTSSLSHSPSRNWVLSRASRVVALVDRHVTKGGRPKRNAARAVPNHWSSWLGYIALFSFVVIIVSGVVLTLWFEPSMAPVTYDGAYAPMRGVEVSEAYASTLQISFEERGGLLTRQIHYWATHVFVAAMALHLLRVFFTGAFRTPRKLNWLIGLGLLVLGVVGAYTGHALPDDLLSGTGLRVIEGGILAIPVIGTYVSSFVFGGEYPGDDIIGRLYVLHVFVIPAIVVAVLALHLVLVRRQGRAQWSGAGRTSRSVVESRFASHIARASGLMVVVVGVIVVMAATLQINPVWLKGPYDPSQVSAASQPDWYVAFLDGGLRLMPPWVIDLFGHELTLAVLVPAIVLPGVMVTALAIYPWIEERIIGSAGDQNVLDRPRDVPARTGLGVAFIAFYVVLLIAGGNDVVASTLGVPMNWLTGFLQVSVIVLPPLAYSITKRICLGLQRREHDRLVHGRETGVTVVSPVGGFSEVLDSSGKKEVAALVAGKRRAPLYPGPELDENGIPAPRPRWSKLRARLFEAYFPTFSTREREDAWR